MPGSAFRLTTLGRLALADPGGVEDPSLATRRRKLALLVVLAVSRRPLTRDALTELFWGDQPEDRARHSLSDALSHLRRVLGPDSIATRRAELSLAPGTPLAVDVVELHAAAQAQQWGVVAALYGGPFLDGVHVHDSPRFEQWVTTQRAHAARLFDTACRHECARLTTAEAWADCAALAARWLEWAPLEPEAAMRMLEALRRGAPDSASGERLALDAHDQLVRRLRTEFDTVPADEVRAAAEALRARRRPVVVTSTSDAPSSDRSVVGPTIGTDTLGPASSISDRHAHPTSRRWLVAAAILLLAAIGVGAWRPRVAEGTASLVARQHITTRSPEARALYIASFATPDLTGTTPDAVLKLEQALALDSSFALAWRRLAQEIDGDENQRARLHDALTRARALTDGVSEYERQIILGDYHMLVSGDLSSAAMAFRAVLALDPRNAATWHRLGMVYQYLGDDTRAADAYAAANRVNPTSAARWINLADVRFAAGDTAGTERAIDSMALHLPGHPSVYVLGANLAAATGDLDRALLQVRAYATSSPGDPRVQAFARMYRSRVHWTAGQLDAGDADAQDAMDRNLARGDAYWAIRDGLARAQVTVWRRHDQATAARQLRTALSRAGFDSLPLLDRPWLEVALTAALVGDVVRSRALLAQYGREIPAYVQYREEAQRHHVEGVIALMAARPAEAVRHLEQAAHPECRICGLAELGLAHESLGDERAARRAYREYLETPTLRRTDLLDALHREWVSERLAGATAAWSPAIVR